MKFGILCTLLVFAAALAGLSHAAAVPVGGAATPSTTQNALLDDLRKRLNSTDPAERQAAQKDLASLAGLFNDADMLQRLADVTTDPQAAAMLRQRLSQLRIARPTPAPGGPMLADPDPISLSLRNASAREMCDALNAALGGDKIQGNTAGGSFTIDVKNKPFWEVLTALQAQQPFNIAPSGPRIMISTAPANGGGTPSAIDGPMITCITTISHRRLINLQAMPEPTAQSDISITVLQALDPRMPASAFGAIVISNVRDDQGGEYKVGAPPNSGSPAGALARSQTLLLTPPQKMGKSISFSLDSMLGAAGGPAGAANPAAFALVGQINDVKAHLNESVAIPGGSLQVAQFDDTGAQIRLRVTLQMTVAQPGVRAACILYDSAGTRVWNGNLTTSVSAVLAARNAGGPYKLEIRAPDAAAAAGRKFHFEFKDVPLP